MNKKIIFFFLIFFMFLQENTFSSQTTKIKNNPPIVRIVTPKSGGFVKFGEKIVFNCEAIDLEDEEISEKELIWKSDLNGQIGEGRTFSYETLSAGSHIITLTAKDSEGKESKHSIFIKVEMQNPTGPNEDPNKKQIELQQTHLKILDPNSSAKVNADSNSIKTIKADPNSLPSIEFTNIPVFGSFNNLKGKVSNANLQEVAVVVLIMKEVAWFTKPSKENPVTKINKEGSWECDITTETSDQLATKIAAFLVPIKYKPPILTGVFRIPNDLEKNKLAKVEVTRNLTQKTK
jgi:hypothetical protein